MAPGKQNETAACPKDKLECLGWTLFSLDPNWEKKNITNELNFRNIHCETFESSFLKLFLIALTLNDFEIVPKAFFTSLLQPMLPCCRPTVCVEVCLHGIFFQWILLQFKAPFWQLSRRKSLPINLIIIRAWLKKRRLRGGHMVIKPPSVDTCVLTSPPPPHTTTTHPKLEL